MRAGADRAFTEANALPRLKELLWLLAPYAELQIIVAECLLCTLHRLVDAHSQYRCCSQRTATCPHATTFHALLRHVCNHVTRLLPPEPVKVAQYPAARFRPAETSQWLVVVNAGG